MDKSSRALRRIQRVRLNRRAKRIYEGWWFDISKNKINHNAVRLRDNMKNCSCFMCGNPRRGKGIYEEVLTMQERKALDSYNDQLEEV